MSNTIDSARTATQDSSADIARFLMRPVEITTVDWAVNGNVNTTFNPWKLWYSNPRVANRLCNYHLFTGKLHLKFVINGNQFYWGRLLASYAPLHVKQPYIRTGTDQPAIDQIAASQRQHLYIDATTSQGGEMVLPYISQHDAIRIPFVFDWDEMGLLWLTDVVSLSHASTTVSKAVRITVYAWATDVTLAVPTQYNTGGLVPQAGDEYGQGIISKPATAVSRLAGTMTNAPVIGKYAMATQMAASAIGSIASMFGFSKPRNIEPVKKRCISNVGDIVACDGADNSQVLAITNKHETTIDPRTVGLTDVDELSIGYLCAKESIITTASWAMADTSKKILASLRVNPGLGMPVTLTVPPSTAGFAYTPMGMVSQCFHFWKGDITFRFQVVASAYHKGRLLITWDPSGGITAPETNTMYSKILDIGEDRDFSMTVKWGSHLPALSVPGFGYPAFAAGVLSSVLGTDNGILTVYVLNDLVSSGDNVTAPVKLIISAWSDNMRFFGPDDSRTGLLTPVVQTPALLKEAEEVADQAAVKPVRRLIEPEEKITLKPNAGWDTKPEGANDHMEIGAKTDLEIVDKVCAGEVITSMRTLLKRYYRRRYRIAFANLAQRSLNIYNYSINLDFIPQLDSDTGVHTTRTTLRGYLGACYLFWRGSVRFKFVPHPTTNDVATTELPMMLKAHYLPNSGRFDPYWAAFNDATPARVMPSVYGGCAMATDGQDYVLSTEVPWISNTRTYNNQSGTSGPTLAMEYSINNSTASVLNHMVCIDELESVGEDFTLMCFQGVPIMWDGGV